MRKGTSVNYHPGQKAAHNGIISAISKGNVEMADKAIDVATQESARYFAKRIARTEKARAYMDGAMYPYAHDPDCVAFKWKLSSRHPCDDICDLYVRADLWGMGEGIFPKDKTLAGVNGQRKSRREPAGSSMRGGIPMK